MAACNIEKAAMAEDTAKTKSDRMSQGSREYVNELSFNSIINQYPMLSAKEEKDLIRKKESEDWPTAKEKLVLGNLRLVASIAKKYDWMDGCSFDDIVSHGVIGLMKAIDRFDPKAGTKLSTYGSYWIQQEIRDELLYKRGQIRSPAYLEKMATRLKRCQTELAREGITDPSVEMLSERTGIPEKKVSKIMNTCNMGVISMDTPVGSDKEDLRIGDVIPSRDSVEDEAVKKITLLDVADAIKKLKPIEQIVIMMRFGFIDGKPITLEQCAKETGYSSEGCRHIQESAIRKLQADYKDKKKRY